MCRHGRGGAARARIAAIVVGAALDEQGRRYVNEGWTERRPQHRLWAGLGQDHGFLADIGADADVGSAQAGEGRLWPVECQDKDKSKITKGKFYRFHFRIRSDEGKQNAHA